MHYDLLSFSNFRGVIFKCHELSDLMGCLWPGHLDFTNFYKISQSGGTNTVNELSAPMAQDETAA